MTHTALSSERFSLKRVAGTDSGNANALISCICILASVLMGTAFVASRIGFTELYGWDVVKAVALSVSLIGLPSLVRAVGGALTRDCPDAPAIASGLALVVLGGMLPENELTLACLFTIAAASLVSCLRELPRLSSRQWLLFGAGSLILALWLSTYVLGRHARDPLILEMSYVHKNSCDAFFHAVLAENMKTYGVTTTGLHGIPAFSYHVASHWIYAQVSRFLSQSALHFYLITYPVVFVPLFLKAFFTAANDLRTTLGARQWTAGEVCSAPFWLLVLTIFVGWIPIGIQSISGLGWGHPFGSESHQLALIVACLSLSTIVGLYAAGGIARAMIAIILPLSLMLLTGIKVVWLAMAPVILGFLAVRERAFRSLPFTVAIPVAVAGAYMVNKLSKASECQGGVKFSPWDFFNYMYPGHHWEFMVFYFLPIWLLLGWSLAKLGIDNLCSFRVREAIACQIVLIMWIGFFALSNMIELKAAAGLWFLDPIRWMALCSIMALAPLHWFKTWPPLGRAVFATAAVAMLIFNAGSETAAAVSRNLKERRSIANLTPGTAQLQGPEKIFRGPQDALNQLPSYQFMHHLQDLGNIRKTERQQTLVFIPQKCQPFWAVPEQPEPFWAIRHDRYLPFLPNAFTRMACLDGMPAAERTPEAYSFDTYARRSSNAKQMSEPLELLESAKRLGFQRVLAVDWIDNHPVDHLYINKEPKE